MSAEIPGMVDPILHFFRSVADTSVFIGLRYGLLAGVAWVLAYVVFYRRWKHRKVVQKLPASAEIRREMLYSALSVVIFAAIGALTILAAREGWTQLYTRRGDYPIAWFWGSIGCAIVLHDTWFYWTHRLMHHRRLFRIFHRVHHLSHNPSPWAAYAFHPAETSLFLSQFMRLPFGAAFLYAYRKEQTSAQPTRIFPKTHDHQTSRPRSCRPHTLSLRWLAGTRGGGFASRSPGA